MTGYLEVESRRFFDRRPHSVFEGRSGALWLEDASAGLGLLNCLIVSDKLFFKDECGHPIDTGRYFEVADLTLSQKKSHHHHSFHLH